VAPKVHQTRVRSFGSTVGQPKNFIKRRDGKEIAITNATKFTKEFTVSFKVKFMSFRRNDQFLVSTDEHAFLIQGLGAKYGANSGKISAWMKTDSGLGPEGHGVNGSDNTGRLLSQKLERRKWYKVKFQKTKDSLLLTVDGKTVSGKVDPNIFAGNPTKEALFDLEAGSSKVVAGKLAGTGDMALRGGMGDLTVIEGAPAPAPEEAAEPAAGPTVAEPAAGPTVAEPVAAPQAARCSAFKCPSAFNLKHRAGAADITGNDLATCCGLEGHCSTYKCPEGFTYKAGKDTIGCENHQECKDVDRDTCCDAVANSQDTDMAQVPAPVSSVAAKPAK